MDIATVDMQDRQTIQAKQYQSELRLLGDKAHFIQRHVTVGQQVQLTGLCELASELDDFVLTGASEPEERILELEAPAPHTYGFLVRKYLSCLEDHTVRGPAC